MFGPQLERELLEAKIAALEANCPLPEVAAMSRTVSPSSGRPYGPRSASTFLSRRCVI